MSSLTRLRRIVASSGPLATVCLRRYSSGWRAERAELSVASGGLVNVPTGTDLDAATYVDASAAARVCLRRAESERRYRCDALGRLSETDAVEVLDQIRRGL